MTRCRITVIKKPINPELADQYCVDKVSPCPCFEVGQEFICELGKPGNFCDWAWRDIHPMVACRTCVPCPSCTTRLSRLRMPESG